MRLNWIGLVWHGLDSIDWRALVEMVDASFRDGFALSLFNNKCTCNKQLKEI